MSPIPQLRLAVPSDVEVILPLFRAYQNHYNQLTTATEEKTRSFLRELVSNVPQGFAIVAEVEARVVGFATGFVTVSGVIAERMVHLGDLYVDPELRRRGIATALLNEVTDQARSRGFGLVRWLALASETEVNRWYNSVVPSSGEFRLYLRPTAAKPNL